MSSAIATRLAALLAFSSLLGMVTGCGEGGRNTTAESVGHRAVTATLTAPVAPREPSRTVAEFGSFGFGAGDFHEPFGIAVDRRSGDVYVVDTNNSRIEKFTGAGRFLLAWGWGVADGRTHALQTCRIRCFSGIAGSGAGQLHFAEGIAVDNDPSSPSRGDVYVDDLHNGRVQKFSPSGRFLLMFGGGVNRTARRDHDRAREDVCPVKPGDICGKGTEGPTAGQLEFAVEGSFIAVGPNGTVYLGQRNAVKAFSPAGVYESRIGLSPKAGPEEAGEAGGVSGLAVNASGDLYVVRHGIVGVNVYAQSGELLRTLEPGGTPAYPEGPTPSLALDPAGNVFIDVYASNQHRVDEFSAGGAKIATFDRGEKAPPGVADKEDGLPGMAYNPRTRELYMVNADINVSPHVARVRVIKPPVP